MSDNRFLSQEEINALLQEDFSDNKKPQQEMDTDVLSPMERDALGEIGNISFGSAATALSILLGQDVDITIPTVEIIRHDELEKEFPIPYVSVHVDYTDGFEGMNMLVIKETDAKIIADLMMGGSGTQVEGQMTELELSAVQEAMNQMMGSAATAMSTLFNKMVNITPPKIGIIDLQQGEEKPNFSEDIIIKVSFRLKVGSLIDSNMMQLLPISIGKNLVANLLGPAYEAAPSQEESATSSSSYTEPASSVLQPSIEEKVNQEPTPLVAKEDTNLPPNPSQPNPAMKAFELPDLSKEQAPQPDYPNLDLLMDIPLRITVELGRTRKKINEILELTDGSIIELEKLVGEPVDILANNKLIAKGEVVVIDENFGVRITEVVSLKERFLN